MPGLISSDTKLHRLLKRPIAGIYSMSNLVSFEPFIDISVRSLCSQLTKRYTEVPQPCDFSFWLHAFVFDTLGEMTFSKPYGFLEQGKDVDGIMGSIWSHFEKVSLIGQVPWIDTVLHINPLLSKIRSRPVSPIVKFAMARFEERKARSKEEEDSINNHDLLSRFLVAQTHPGTPPFATFAWVSGNITAGSDSTAIILRTIFYYLLKNPTTMQNLRDEILQAGKSGLISEPPTWQETQGLRYLDACVKEAQRIHPPIGFHLERLVPKEGSMISGKFLKGGTIVGVSAWVVHRDTAIFGEDTDQWKPERWLDCTDEQRLKMEKTLFTVSTIFLWFSRNNQNF